VHDHVGLLRDEALLHNIAHRCEDCFDLLFLRFYRLVLNLAYKIIRDRPEAEDVVQEVFLAIHEQRERVESARGKGSYLGVAIRVLQDLEAQEVPFQASVL
jgi:RNA polymerase sigma-70 factor (ECF subfamily)